MHKAKQSKLSRLRERCKASIPELFAEVKKMGGKISGKKGKQHAHMDRGSNILAVAHLDHVQQDFHFEKLFLPKRKWVYCPRLDDRLGVFTILDVLPKKGIVLDVLFTENEEKGASTAEDFKTEKKYNWVVEFDRRGEDVVFYKFREMEKHVSPFFVGVGRGSFSDICHLEDLGCLAFNVGVGYQDEHRYLARFDVDVYKRQINRFVDFYRVYHDLHLEHSKTTYKYAYQRDRSYSTYEGKGKWSRSSDDYWGNQWSGKGSGRTTSNPVIVKSTTPIRTSKSTPARIIGVRTYEPAEPQEQDYPMLPDFDEQKLFDAAWREFERQEESIQDWIKKNLHAEDCPSPP